MVKKCIPDWDVAVRMVASDPPECAGELLAQFPRIMMPGKVSVIFAESHCLLSPVGRYLANCIALRGNVDEVGRRVVVFCFHETAEEWFMRMAKGLAEIDDNLMAGGVADPDSEVKPVLEAKARYEQACKVLKESTIEVVDANGMDMDEMEQAVRDSENPANIGLIVVDDLLGCTCGRSSDVSLGWSMVGERLSRMARTWNAPVVVLATAPEERLSCYGNLFNGFGSLRDYLESVFTIGWSDHADNVAGILRRYEFHLVFGSGCIDPFVMEYNPSAGCFVGSCVNCAVYGTIL